MDSPKSKDRRLIVPAKIKVTCHKCLADLRTHQINWIQQNKITIGVEPCTRCMDERAKEIVEENKYKEAHQEKKHGNHSEAKTGKTKVSG